MDKTLKYLNNNVVSIRIVLENGIAGHDNSFLNVVAHWATIEPYLVARPEKWLPRICLRCKKFS